MKRIIKRILVAIIIICLIILTKIIYKMTSNQLFIENYPSKQQEYRLKVNTFLNIYEPYVVYYNYGNFFFENEQYEEAKEQYLNALKYDMPNENLCKVSTNMALTIYKQSEQMNSANKKKALEEANNYIQKCMVLKIDNNRYQLSFFLLIIIGLIGVTLIILGIIVRKRKGLLPTVNFLYMKKLEEVKNELACDDINEHEAYLKMSSIIREFVEKVTKINVSNLSKSEIEKLGIKDLNLIMDEIYSNEFNGDNNLDAKNSINRAMEVIKKWKWR